MIGSQLFDGDPLLLEHLSLDAVSGTSCDLVPILPPQHLPENSSNLARGSQRLQILLHHRNFRFIGPVVRAFKLANTGNIAVAILIRTPLA